jgi:hypothetical protein
LDWIIIIILVVLLLAALGPRAGWYGTTSGLYDIVALILLVVLVFWLLEVLGVVNVFA